MEQTLILQVLSSLMLNCNSLFDGVAFLSKQNEVFFLDQFRARMNRVTRAIYLLVVRVFGERSPNPLLRRRRSREPQKHLFLNEIENEQQFQAFLQQGFTFKQLVLWIQININHLKQLRYKE